MLCLALRLRRSILGSFFGLVRPTTRLLLKVEKLLSRFWDEPAGLMGEACFFGRMVVVLRFLEREPFFLLL
jgi:hypothetical protein